ncbi:U-box domain-containing protein 52-like [Zingiber officinale]|uniref:U-box domain-containing protein 52-like n=1 Tax=Zingiber officinale TaxID=94328 RepID=UPI001C4C087E|nr:U-box domain-containing protein 52-like [Zingiber officinale]
MSEGQVSPMVVVAMDRDKSSQNAFKWALDNLVTAGQTLTLLHVNTKTSMGQEDEANYIANITRDIINPCKCFCARKDVQCKEIIVKESDVAKAIIDFVSNIVVEKLVVGASPKGGFVRAFRSTDLSTTIYKGVPDFSTVYVISKGKVLSLRNASRPPPTLPPPIRSQIQAQPIGISESARPSNRNAMKAVSETPVGPWSSQKESDSIKSPFNRGTRASATRSYGEIMVESDISFVSSSRPSIDHGYPQRYSNMLDNYERNFESPRKSVGAYSIGNEQHSSLSHESSSSQSVDDVETEIRRLKLELKQTMDMYSTACKEALTAKQKAMELQRWKMGEEKRLEEATLALAESEKAKRIAESEAQRASNPDSHANLRYRRYSIEEIEAATENFLEKRKIGEGGYGPVYKCNLDHTPVAIKVLRPDAAHGKSQFQQEVEILCCIRHPNMVLLLGACPEYGCLVYEHMALGSLEDRLFRRGNTPPIPWQHRFRIAAEIGTGLLFLHQTKPEPLVHRDLKPANILLDRNYVSKISDVGLARLVPPSVANNVTQYRMTATAGTFCYIDPEYQQTGMLGTKSDVYSLGILLLQLISAKPPMGLSHYMDRAIEKGTFGEMLDQSVPDWPVEEALSLAKVALQCAELRKKDRPDLATVILPELNRLRELAEDNLEYGGFGMGSFPSSISSHVSTQDGMNGHGTIRSGSESSRSPNSGIGMLGRR